MFAWVYTISMTLGTVGGFAGYLGLQTIWPDRLPSRWWSVVCIGLGGVGAVVSHMAGMLTLGYGFATLGMATVLAVECRHIYQSHGCD